MPYSRVQFTSPQRGEVGLRSKPGEGALHLTIDRNPSPQPSPNGRGSALPLPLHLTILKKGGSGESGCRYIWSAPNHFIGHLSAKRSWLFSTMVATVFSASWPS